MFVIILSLRTSIQENKFFHRKTRSLCLKWIQEWLEKKPQPLEDELLHIILRFICQPKIDNRFICILNMHTSDVTLHFPVQLFVIFLRLFSFYSTLCQRYQAVWTAELQTMSSSMNSSTSGVKKIGSWWILGPKSRKLSVTRLRQNKCFQNAKLLIHQTTPTCMHAPPS
jgi:hypothetical protein